MKAKQKDNDQAPVPISLRNWAKKIRFGKKFGSVRYPLQFKKETLGLLQNGVKIGVICQTLAINPRSLQAWEKAAGKKRLDKPERQSNGVRELILIPDKRDIQDRVKIQIGGKVWIEAPASILQGAFLRELSELEAT